MVAGQNNNIVYDTIFHDDNIEYFTAINVRWILIIINEIYESNMITVGFCTMNRIIWGVSD